MRSQIWSFFSGGMGLDLGLETVGLAADLAMDNDKNCRKTIETNRPGINVHPVGDVTRVTAASLRKYMSYDGDVFLISGGPPCQSFSTGGKRAALSDPRGNLIYTYLALINTIRPRYFILENVANLITAAIRHRPIRERPGQHWSLKKYTGTGVPHEEGMKPLEPDELSGSAIRQILVDVRELGYGVNFGILNAAEFGAPQKRLRFVMLGALDSVPPKLPKAEFGADGQAFRTVRDAIGHLATNPGPHSEYTPDVAKVFAQVPEGGTWRDLPADVARRAMGKAYDSGGGRTGFFRRLAWDQPAPTVTGRMNRKASAMCHPEAVRPISVSEALALQGFPAEWQLSGSMSAQYLQVGNAVPLALGAALGRSILAHVSGHGESVRHDPDRQLAAALDTLRGAARNKRGARSREDSPQLDLFASRR